MEEGKFSELMKALRVLRSVSGVRVDIMQFVGLDELTPEQKSIILREFTEPARFERPDINFGNDYF